MRLSLAVNGTQRTVAAVSGSGFLNVHLNLHDRPQENDHSKVVRVVGTQTLETETIGFEWPTVKLNTGDRIEIRLLGDGEGDAPSEIRRSSESPRNLFSRRDLAEQLLALVSEFDSQLVQLVDKSEQMQTEEEHRRFTSAVGRVSYEVGASFLYPIYRRHPQLIPEDLKGELL
jgi:hypothetical protein